MNASEPRPALAWLVHRHTIATTPLHQATATLRHATPVLRRCYGTLLSCYASATAPLRHATQLLRNRYAATINRHATPTAHLYRHHFDGQFKNFTPVLPNINLHYTALTNSAFSTNSTPVSGKK